MIVLLPVASQAAVDSTDRLTIHWRQWADAVTRQLNAAGTDNTALAAAVEAIARALGSPDGTVENIPEQEAIDSLIFGRNGVMVTGRLSQGNVYVELTELEDTGTGTALYKFTRDAYGRVEGTESATTSDLPEGSNLYYTDTRADARVAAGIATHVAAADPHTQYLQAGEAEPPITAGTTAQYWRGDKAWRDFGTDVRAAALTGLSTATATAITATDTVLDGFGKAQAQINANVAALAGKASTGVNTFTGNQTIQNSGSPSLSIISTSTGSALCNLDSQAGTLALFAFKTNGLNRILFTKGSVAETGSNVGSDAEIRAHTDAGAFNFRILTLKRDSGDLIFGRDNLQNLGGASNRLKEIFCGNATINTSDAREKTPLRPLTNAELAVARELSGMAGMFQWLASVEDKGGAARLHAGLIAQDVVATFAAHGLDANRYGFVCYDEWPETVEPAEYEDVLDADGEPTGERVLVKPEITRPAGNRYGIRYGELAMFLIAGQEQRLRALEAKA